MEKTIGCRLKKIRESHNYTQSQMADYLGVSESEIEKLENNTTNLKSSTLTKLCDLYGCQPEHLFNEEHHYGIRTDVLDLNTIASMNIIIRNLKQLHELSEME